jgi:putative flippase GtrA
LTKQPSFRRHFDRITGIQFVRYVLVGVALNLTLFIAYILLTELEIGHKTAMTVLYVTGTCLAFVLNKSWTFGYKGHISKSFMGYILIYAFGYFLNFVGLYFFADKLGYSHQWVQGILVFLIALLLFFLQKELVFKKGMVRQIYELHESE